MLAAVSMAKNEEDVAYGTLVHLAEEGVQLIIAANNLSTDDTQGELERAAKDVASMCQVIIVQDDEPGYYQSVKQTRLAAMAGERGAEWIIPFDFDELWVSTVDRLSVFLEQHCENYTIVKAPLFNHYATALDPAGDNPFKTMQWRDAEPGALPKVAFRWRTDAVVKQGNHAVAYLTGGSISERNDGLQIRHFPYRSYDHFKRKAIAGAAAYAATNLPETEGAHWRQYGTLLERFGEDALREVFEQWFWFYAPVNAGLIHDPAPFRRWSS